MIKKYGGDYLGVVILIIANLFFVLSSYFGKIVTSTTEMTAVVTSFSRFLIGSTSMLIYILFKKKSFKAGNLKPIAVRSIFNSVSVIFMTWSLQYTTITNANMLQMTYPVFVILLAPLITKEENKNSNFIHLFIIMLGSYIVSNPSFKHINIGDFIALTSAVSAAISVLYLTISRRENEAYIIIFYVMLIGTIINLPFAIKDLTNFDFSGLLPTILAGLTGFLGQIFFTWGYKYVDSATGAMISTSRIVMAAIIGFVFLSEPINLRIITGIILITISLIEISGYFKRDKSHESEV